jgi:hypothetical protein
MICPHCKKTELVVKNFFPRIFFAFCEMCQASWATRSTEQQALDAVVNGEIRIPPKRSKNEI